MKIHPLSVIVPLVVALVAVALLGLDRSGAASDCRDADQSRTSDLLHQAQKSYASTLSDKPDSDCAVTGMKKTLIRLCHRGDDLRADGADEEARKVYAAVLEADPGGEGHRCAHLGLKELAPSTAGSADESPSQCCQICPRDADEGHETDSDPSPSKDREKSCRLDREAAR